jgi:hypothetical protein
MEMDMRLLHWLINFLSVDILASVELIKCAIFLISNYKMMVKFLLCLFLQECLTAFVSKIDQIGPQVFIAELLPMRYLTADAEILPVRQWLPPNGKPSALLIAVHGINEYSHFFESVGNFFQNPWHCFLCLWPEWLFYRSHAPRGNATSRPKRFDVPIIFSASLKYSLWTKLK